MYINDGNGVETGVLLTCLIGSSRQNAAAGLQYMVVLWLRSDAPNASSRTEQTAGEAVDDESWLDYSIAGPLQRGRTDEHDDAGCDFGWIVWAGCGELIAFYGWRSWLFTSFFGQSSNRPICQ